MNYISLSFAIFLISLLTVYALTPNQHKWKVLLLFSIIFYAMSGLDKLLFILGTSLIVDAAALRMDKIWTEFDNACGEEQLQASTKRELKKKYAKRSRQILSIALFLCIGILFWCKYGVKTVSFINRTAGTSLTAKIIVPLGISYYTFSSIGYLLDVYWRKVCPSSSYPRLLLCMIYFPHIAEGPISRYNRLLPQLDTLTFPSYTRFTYGLQLMLWGCFKKMVIADRLAIFVNNVFNDIEANEGLIFPIALIFGAFQMYTDFSGCMDIVTGISDILGIQLDKNFQHPFFSQSAAEFWRRWHITLGTWFKDYVYIPITTSSFMRRLRKLSSKKFGDKGSKYMLTTVPTMTVWLLTGIWHGTGKNYIVWGLYWGILIVSGELLSDKLNILSERLHINTNRMEWRVFRTLRTFTLYAIGGLALFPKNLEASLLVAKRIFSTFNIWIFWDQSLYSHGLDRRNFILAVLSILFLLLADAAAERVNVREKIAKRNIVIRWCIYYIGILAVLIFGIYGPGYDPQAFVYQQF